MPSQDIAEKYLPKDNRFYKVNYHRVVYAMMAVLTLLIVLIVLVTYQIVNRPLPVYMAKKADGETRQIQPYTKPNLLPDTILRWAGKAATTAYTFDFVNYNDQINAVRPYFTTPGWNDYLASVRGLITTIVARQIFVYGVVSGVPVISNQGDLPGKGYSWQVQVPFLVTYQAAETSSTRNFIVRMTLVRVPTNENPQGIGIDQFVMVKA